MSGCACGVWTCPTTTACTANLSGLGGRITATATATINADGSCIEFTLENTSALNPDNSSTLIDQFFFELAGAFIPNITGSSDVGWTFVDNNGNNVTPVDCGLFRYKFQSGAPTTRLETDEIGTFTICSTAGTFTAASIANQPVCARFQRILG
ncbi:hypothetical protein ASG99_11805 [Bacillus sp. Soil768D1]|nr:hypothetical protein ASG99_11805 [Bacillus sp. Soil768D1]